MDAKTIADDAVIGATIIGKVAGGIDAVLPWLMLAGGLIPGADTVLAALQIAEPIIKKVAAVAPLVVKAINDGAPVVAAIDNASPSMIADIKDMMAIFTGATTISDSEAYAFAGPVIMGRPWTDAEMQGAWDKADGAGIRDGAGNKPDGW